MLSCMTGVHALPIRRMATGRTLRCTADCAETIPCPHADCRCCDSRIAADPLLQLLQCRRRTPSAEAPLPGPLPLFPPDNWWNQDISQAPVDPRSAQFIAFINNGGTRRLHPDFGGYESPGSVEHLRLPLRRRVGGNQPKRAVAFYYGDESDGVDHATGQSCRSIRFPTRRSRSRTGSKAAIPARARAGGDRHMLIVDRDNRHLYELFDLRWNGSHWTAGRARSSISMRTRGGPRAGRRPMPPASRFFPASCATTRSSAPDEIRHAFRVTVRATNGYVWPASHRAGSNSQALPMGARLRLKASKDLSGFHPGIQKIFRAMQRYGLIVADNGSDMYISGDVRSALAQRHPQSGVPLADRQRFRGDRAWAGAARPAACPLPARRRRSSFSQSGGSSSLSWAAAAVRGRVRASKSARRPASSNMLVASMGNGTSISRRRPAGPLLRAHPRAETAAASGRRRTRSW